MGRREKLAPVAPTQRLGRPLDAICGARSQPWDDDVCVLSPGHTGVHVDFVGGAWGHDARHDTTNDTGGRGGR
jgi:hypothetical protein